MAADVLVSRDLKSLQDELSAAKTQRAANTERSAATSAPIAPPTAAAPPPEPSDEVAHSRAVTASSHGQFKGGTLASGARTPRAGRQPHLAQALALLIRHVQSLMSP
jgi:hypothetical protein